jgi:molybdopterin-guanine dinucleotide biosynthesis protein A
MPAADDAARARTAGLILCGGRSSRMGADKAALRIGPRTLLDMTLERMHAVAAQVAVSVAAEARVPQRPGVLWVRDEAAYRGPLFGLLHGFRAVAGSAERVVAMPVDMPFLTVPWLKRLLEGLEGHAACAFRWQGYTNALTAAYRLDVLPLLESLVAEGKQRPMALLDGVPARILEVESLWRAEDGPPPLLDTDTPEDYREALLLAGYGEAGGADVTVAVPGPEGGVVVPLRAATAGEVLRCVAELYPERRGGPARGAIERVGADGVRAPLAANDALMRGDTLHWTPAGTGS